NLWRSRYGCSTIHQQTCRRGRSLRWSGVLFCVNETGSRMNLFECFRVAIRGLANNKMRTALTMLGIIMGVGVVIIVVAIGEGATQRVTETVNSLGTNLLMVFPSMNRLRINATTSSTATSSGTG